MLFHSPSLFLQLKVDCPVKRRSTVLHDASKTPLFCQHLCYEAREQGSTHPQLEIEQDPQSSILIPFPNSLFCIRPGGSETACAQAVK